MMDVTPERLKKEMDGQTPVTVVDLQSADKYDHAHIPGAVNLPMEKFEAEYADVLKDKDAAIVLYGEYDELGKGSKAGELLKTAGYTRVGHVVGGVMAWKEAGYPIEGGQES